MLMSVKDRIISSTSGLYLLACFFLFVYSLALIYINVFMLDIRTTLVYGVVILPLLMSFLYLLVSLNKIRRNRIIDASVWSIIILVLLGQVTLNYPHYLIISLTLLLIGLIYPKVNKGKINERS